MYNGSASIDYQQEFHKHHHSSKSIYFFCKYLSKIQIYAFHVTIRLEATIIKLPKVSFYSFVSVVGEPKLFHLSSQEPKVFSKDLVTNRAYPIRIYTIYDGHHQIMVWTPCMDTAAFLLLEERLAILQKLH